MIDGLARGDCFCQVDMLSIPFSILLSTGRGSQRIIGLSPLDELEGTLPWQDLLASLYALALYGLDSVLQH